ncbi:MAG: AAA family ATPase [Akkermansiaceae bacterium]
MITRLHIKNFKSLADFWFPSQNGPPLAPLTVLVGLNSSGKSTLLQAFDFFGQLASGNLTAWLESRDWKAAELLTFNSTRSRTIQFALTWQDKEHGEVSWWGRYNTNTKRCTQEIVSMNGEPPNLLNVNGPKFGVVNDKLEREFTNDVIPFDYEGSILSVLKLDKLHPALKALKIGLVGLKSLELLSPHLMRKRAKSAYDIGSGGEKLSAFLSSLSQNDLAELSGQLRKFYPHLDSLSVKSLKAGWKNLVLKEDYSASSEYGAAQINDGMLRVVGVLAQAYAQHSVVLFDEIENGVNQQIVGQLMDFLLELSKKRQVLITTHSPLILNFLPDDKAREGVIFLYKDKRGATHARRFFELDQVKWKMDGLGPGEAFVDTDLTALSAELANEEGGNA